MQGRDHNGKFIPKGVDPDHPYKDINAQKAAIKHPRKKIVEYVIHEEKKKPMLFGMVENCTYTLFTLIFLLIFAPLIASLAGVVLTVFGYSIYATYLFLEWLFLPLIGA